MSTIDVHSIPERMDLVSVLVDMLYAKADVSALVTEIAERWPCGREVMNDGCEGDTSGLDALLTEPHVVVFESYWAEQHEHSGNMIVVLADGRVIHANCGGCSCGGSGDWVFRDDVGDAWRMVPEQERP